MLVRFFFLLRKLGVPVSITELLALLEALRAGLGDLSAERFYYLSRTCLVKDERYYDRFDRAFAAHFKMGSRKWRNANSPTPRRRRSRHWAAGIN
jgi:uncharacterized protein with von Willebrand factor type A (vWA) domain